VLIIRRPVTDALPVAVVAVVGVACCAGLPAIVGLVGALTVGAVLGVAGGVLLGAALLGAAVLGVRTHRRRSSAGGDGS
jgi:hypothetical protein